MKLWHTYRRGMIVALPVPDHDFVLMTRYSFDRAPEVFKRRNAALITDAVTDLIPFM